MGYYYQHSSELYHHGILGMKWGVRRYQNKDGSYTAEGKLRRSEDHTSKSHSDYEKRHDGKNVRELSDAELRDRLNRLQMENQYKQLSSSSVAAGEKYVSDFVKALGTAVTITGAAVTLYQNYGKIAAIVEELKTKKS